MQYKGDFIKIIEILKKDLQIATHNQHTKIIKK